MQNLRHLCDPIPIDYLLPELINIIRGYYGNEFVPTRILKGERRFLDVIDGDIYALERDGFFFYLVKNNEKTSICLHPNVEHIEKVNEHQLLATSCNSGYLCDLRTSEVIHIKEAVCVVDGEIYMFTRDRRLFRYGCESLIGSFNHGSRMARVGNSLMIIDMETVTLIGRPHAPQKARWLYEWNNEVYAIKSTGIADVFTCNGIDIVIAFEQFLVLVTEWKIVVIDLTTNKIHRINSCPFLLSTYNCFVRYDNGDTLLYE